jgi:homoaconitate hydratase
LKDQKVHGDVELYVAAASNEVQKICEDNGTWQTLLSAGARPLPPGCGPCIGMGAGLLKDGEVGISATNRNFKGRMGSPSAFAYLASPAVVAASAIAGKITSPGLLNVSKEQASALKTSISNSQVAHSSKSEPLLKGFPHKLEGSLILLNGDNINTDGIYAGKYTYREDLSPQQMADVAMENYDPDFSKIADEGCILLAGYNFGTGSSREQAATCLKYKGVSLVIAGSFSATYTRNAINNGFLVLESPRLIEYVRKSSKLSDSPTQKLSDKIYVDLEHWSVSYDGQEFPLTPMGAAAQEIIVSGGLEPWLTQAANSRQETSSTSN